MLSSYLRISYALANELTLKTWSNEKCAMVTYKSWSVDTISKLWCWNKLDNGTSSLFHPMPMYAYLKCCSFTCFHVKNGLVFVYVVCWFTFMGTWSKKYLKLCKWTSIWQWFPLTFDLSQWAEEENSGFRFRKKKKHKRDVHIPN